MISKKVFINTILVLSLVFIGILTAFYFYYEHKIEDIEQMKDSIKIIQDNNNLTGLENVIVE